METNPLTLQLQQLAHACVADQERFEREHGTYDVKAALWALGSLHGCIDAEPQDTDTETYLEQLLTRMREHQKHYRSDTFIEEYGGGRASMGSAINAFEGKAKALLHPDPPSSEEMPSAIIEPAAEHAAKEKWPWYIWVLLLAGFLFAVLRADEPPKPHDLGTWSTGNTSSARAGSGECQQSHFLTKERG